MAHSSLADYIFSPSDNWKNYPTQYHCICYQWIRIVHQAKYQGVFPRTSKRIHFYKNLWTKKININSKGTLYTPPLWTDLVKMLTRKLRHASSFSLECTDFKNVIFEKIPWAHSEDAEVAEVKRPRNPKRRKF
jgi:hypothetical protein